MRRTLVYIFTPGVCSIKTITFVIDILSDISADIGCHNYGGYGGFSSEESDWSSGREWNCLWVESGTDGESVMKTWKDVCITFRGFLCFLCVSTTQPDFKKCFPGRFSSMIYAYDTQGCRF